MCGIVGFAGAGSRSDLECMSSVLRHRGPDGDGTYLDPRFNVGLGHRRLTVLDPEGGHQPMWNEDHTVTVVFNGEIYNAQELRDQLVARGHVFRSHHSDTEVLVHGYEEWGASLPIRLNGMFAFAIYDVTAARLFLARDRFGEKPLYYAAPPGRFAFASELTALRRHPGTSTDLDPKAIQKLFAYGYIPAPGSAVRGVRKLRAGWMLEYDCRTATLSEKEYWRFRLEPDDALEHAREEVLVEELRALLSAAVRRRLVSDVPLGLFLSGGVDSATVLAFASRHLPASEVSTFTVGFTEPSYDESEAARALASWFGTNHQATSLSVNAAYPLIDEILGQLDEPLADPSLLPTFLICRFARQSVTVALTGDGSDELFAGYDPFVALAPANVYSRLVPSGLHGLIRQLAGRLPQSSSYMSWDFRLRRALTGLSYPKAIWNPVWMSPIEPRAMPEFFDGPLSQEELYEEAIDSWNTSTQPDLFSRSLEFFTRMYLQNDILTKVDRASMMVSLETRAVFLDNDLVDFCRRLPNVWKMRSGQRKYLLKRALSGLVPDAVLHRRKQGFAVPVSSWLRQLSRPDGGSLPGVRENAMRQSWDQHQGQQHDERLLLWTWLTTQRWAATHGFVVQ
jgi:asparagine synthase (glutamine-hydrolysing)